MTDDSIDRAFARYAQKVEVMPTPEQFRRLWESGNLTIGGGGRMESAILLTRFTCPFDILDEAGAFDTDYRDTISRFRNAKRAFDIALRAHAGFLSDEPVEESDGIPLQALYAQLVTFFRRDPETWQTLLMLVEPLKDGVTRRDIDANRHYLLPLSRDAELAVIDLANAMLAISKEWDRKAEEQARAAADVEALDRKLSGQHKDGA